MHHLRSAAPIAATITLALVLAACGQTTANQEPPATPVATPDAIPTPDASPTPVPTPAVTPTPKPVQEPERPATTPTPKPVATPTAPPQPVGAGHAIPSVAQVTADGVNVRTAPSTTAPLLDGERLPDLAPIQVRVDAGQQVRINYGPVIADGESWYNVAAVGGSDIWIGGDGWIAGRFLASLSEAEQYPLVVAVSGNGTGTTADAELPGSAALTVSFGAAPLAGQASCRIDVSLVRTDGRTVTVAGETVTDAVALGVSAFEMEGLYQQNGGTVRLHVETDCAFAAALTAPMS